MYLNRRWGCVEIENELSSFIDDELDDAVKERVEKHLRSCKHCREEHRKLLDIKKKLKRLERIEVDSNIPLNIISKLSETEPSPEVKWFPVTIRVALLFAILLNITLFSLFRNYRWQITTIPTPKPITIENIVIVEEEGGVSVSFSAPMLDTIPEYIPPEIAYMKKPSYSKKMFSQNIEGTVVLNIVVDELGKVKIMEIKRKLSPEADSLSIASARKMKFTPAKIGTLSVEGFITASFSFKL